MNIVTSGVVTLNMNNQRVFPYLITLITAGIQSLRQGNVFTRVCHSVHRGMEFLAGGMSPLAEGCCP